MRSGILRQDSDVVSGPGDPIRPCPACGHEKTSSVGQLNGWVLARCSLCDLVYTRDLPTSEKIGQVYNEAYERDGLYDAHLKQLDMMIKTGRSRQGFYRNRLFLKRFKPQPGEKLLEIGCGIGAFLVAAHQRGWQVEGVDISARALEVSCNIHGLTVYHGTLEEINVPVGTYKAIVCWEVLEHLPSPRQFLQHAKKLLRNDGLFVCSIPNCSDKVPLFVDKLGPASVPPVHLNFWTLASFKRFSELNGFRVVHLFTKRNLMAMAGAKKRPLQLAWKQLAAIIGLLEGPNIYAVLTPSDPGSQ
ncbi:MAG: hypothetical protein Nkreftii_001408 [Candidatus Nitrospira kreftii]|uniref:Class I SAM-dependent methyltransferase n=1 Tax=Candidatus Nitrospira kreftii TaxID=2652173 RepID=A0A7S8FCL6_9BACT|nr:MAG: hypothetical protein Nkreftii_001408 [Candidatus Nitrospira kreftii]